MWHGYFYIKFSNSATKEQIDRFVKDITQMSNNPKINVSDETINYDINPCNIIHWGCDVAQKRYIFEGEFPEKITETDINNKLDARTVGNSDLLERVVISSGKTLDEQRTEMDTIKKEDMRLWEV